MTAIADTLVEDSIRRTGLAVDAAPVAAVAAPVAVPVAPTRVTAPTNPTPSAVEIAALFDRWNASLQSLDPAKVVANYAPNSVLLPTLSDVVRHSDAEKMDYFRHFLTKRPVGMIDHRTIMVNEGTAIDIGHYTFYFHATGESARCRYTFTYGWDGAQWLITTHHSSMCP